MRTFSRAANSVILPTNGFQMFQTKKPFWIQATVTSSLSVIKKKRAELVEMCP